MNGTNTTSLPDGISVLCSTDNFIAYCENQYTDFFKLIDKTQFLTLYLAHKMEHDNEHR